MNYSIEIWKDIPQFEGVYQVSNHGRVWSHKTRKYKKTSMGTHGYPMMCLCANHKVKTFSMHRLVALAFIPNPYNKPDINHINGIRNDFRIENLEWCTKSENGFHSYRVLGRIAASKGIKGKLHSESKPIIQLTKNGEFVKEWESQGDILSGLNISNCWNIINCCHNKKYFKTARGFIWKFKT